MTNHTDHAAAIAAVLSDYFKGVFKGDINRLRSVFHPQALVAGDVNGQGYFKTLEQYLDGVKNRKSPFELGESYRMEIISIEVINLIAVAKLRLPMFEFNYYDLLSLTIVDGKWVIVNKLLTNVSVVPGDISPQASQE
ncbi:nuclear transport factor 2 family protein [Dyadobacter fanqingshengii]|uniref:Nuclear transport factor 2 family protein n=1 Tax=Dyadobacter fanqingshengii TaxID=2906443 RepID=A0A9X1THA5_9BACT|nr:nuclear transport factor 2 family protein [Dyadobacter fanqingshengii]MCF0041422.1 nuclear transport factor 2 family protein [Dyadobacter fanqingshengii]USJ36857.1 nuclear transport factor 2 family protein [Dyadobacter fanqingshengii]